jgi:methylase of polypeptide subunit release factors
LISRTAREAPTWLSRNGWLLLEVSTDRVKDVKPVLQRSGFREVRSTKGGTLPITRVIVAKRPA